MILHHIQSSTVQRAGLRLALRYAGDRDALIISGDAAGSVLQASWQTKLAGKRVYFLDEDVHARGLTDLISARYPDAQLVDYSGWVKLSLTFDKVITW
ncbi:sulfurtransferase complex subunit TusB [Shewanella sp. FJAT-52076]|uniref:sulfurtransferase complex subunit TusB n=1 Tax=Shewanella sp. FJAT-52076 TaxID=2864202 RepID=UPI001C655DA4|nr:sulfurtransferase complex subunit TusB [Shewanella sp. FJAT-52076]QYJ77093.1 sulfurtransferase complex subunit TusB [Shewanella sp. FJAT-52076]